MDVLDEHDGGTFAGELFHEAHDGGLEALTGVERVRGARGDPEREHEVLASLEPPRDLVTRAVLHDAVVLLDDLAQRPVRDAVAVRQAAAGASQRGGLLGGEQLPQLTHERRLADPRLPDDRQEVRLAQRDRAPERREQEVDLGLATDERTAEAGRAPRTRERERALDRTSRQALRDALRLGDAPVAELECAPDRGDRALAGEDLPGLRGLLQPVGRVHGVAGHERAALPRHADHDLARVDADAHLDLAAEGPGEAPLHREGCVKRALGVIFERDRRAEDGHDGVSGELLHRPAGPLDLVRHRVVEALEQGADALRVSIAGVRGRADEVGE